MILEALVDAPNSDYQQAEIRVLPGGDGDDRWLVELHVPDRREFPAVPFVLDRQRLEGEVDPHKYGRALGQMLFSDQVLGIPYKETLAVVGASHLALRLRLRLDRPGAAAIHWERLYQPEGQDWGPVATTQSVLLSRHVLIEDWQGASPVAARPVRVLAVIASPKHLKSFEVDPIKREERQALHDIFDGLPDVQVTYLESDTAHPPTLFALRQALQDGYHMVHFLCHGALVKDENDRDLSVLYLEDEEPVTGPQIVRTFGDLSSPPLLCFLAACESAAAGRSDGFLPLGPDLVARGHVEAVIAMSERVGVETARHFTGQFYSELMRYGIVDLAANSARQLVQEKWDWGAPVLFCSQWDSQLLDYPASGALSRTGEMMRVVRQAKRQAPASQQGQQLIESLERILTKFQESFQRLVDFGADLRQTGSNPASFPDLFEKFYNRFKEYYDGETFLDEDDLLRELREIRARSLPTLRSSLTPDQFASLQSELDDLNQTKGQLVLGFGEYLESMNTAADEIWRLLGDRDVDAAIRAKREFEMRISASLKLSKSLLRQAGDRVGMARAA